MSINSEKRARLFYSNFHFSEFDSSESECSYKLKTLKLCIRKYCETAPSIAQLIPLLFPNLEDLVIHHVHPREFESLKYLRNLSRLQSFMIGKISCSFLLFLCITILLGGVQLHHIVPVLERVGNHLTHLRYLP